MGAFKIKQSTRAGRVFDPVFACMVGAMVLAVASSVTLRAVMAGSGELRNSSEERMDAGAGAPPRIMPHKAPPRQVGSPIEAKQNP